MSVSFVDTVMKHIRMEVKWRILSLKPHLLDNRSWAQDLFDHV